MLSTGKLLAQKSRGQASIAQPHQLPQLVSHRKTIKGGVSPRKCAWEAISRDSTITGFTEDLFETSSITAIVVRPVKEEVDEVNVPCGDH
jgi:hypothetical protein